MGDFTFLGWTTTLLYVVACYFTYQTYGHHLRRRDDSTTGLLRRRGWALIFSYLFILGINKQLDVQYLLTEGGKNLVVALELYQFHRTVQLAVFAVAAVLAFASAFLAVPSFVRGSSFLRVSFVGLGVVAAFVLFRAALFQKISSKVDLPFIVYLEPTGIIIMIAGAYGESKVMKNERIRG